MTNSTNKPTTSFWIISVVALIWNLMGVMAYLAQAYMTDEALAELSEAEQALYNMPAWTTGAFALAVFGATLGCILLLLRKKSATLVLTISLVAVLARMIYIFGMTDIADTFETGGIIMTAMVVLIAIFLVWYSKQAASKGLLT